MEKVDVMESVYDRNEQMAKELNAELSEKKSFVINLLGSPGAGKTSTLLQIIPRLDAPAWVIEGDIESDIDTVKLRAAGVQTHQINTQGACHLDAPLVADAARKLAPENGYLFIENIGNLVCPAEFVIGEHIKLLLANVTEGSDKPYKYPLAFEKADIILVNKTDLIDYVHFDRDEFMRGVRALNKKAPVFWVSAAKGEGYEEVVTWIKEQADMIRNI